MFTVLDEKQLTYRRKFRKTVLVVLVFLLAVVVLGVGSQSHAVVEAAVETERPLTDTNANNFTDNFATAAPGDWPMAGANPERTSWSTEEVRGQLRPAWYKPIEPYISQKVQIIAANDTLYISTAKGLYALNADTGAERWVYPTEMPLGHSPTIAGNVAYVGGMDRKIHAIDALTGQGLWTFEAGAGFQTNPLVIGDKLYAGSRDGYMYAIYVSGPNTGQLAWKYATGGPILFSAAYKDGIIFFASNDSYAYALNANTGALVWKSAKLPGAGFYSWWPVVYNDRVIFSGSSNYRTSNDPGNFPQVNKMELFELYPNYATQPKGTLIGALSKAPGSWVAGTPTINASAIYNYFNQRPYRKTVFVLDRFTGQERETASVLWAGTQSGNRYPPVVGGDGVLYQQNNYMSDPSIAGGQISGWQPGSNYISVITSDWGAVDEPHAASGGGNMIYWNLCCDRSAGGIDISIPNSDFYNRYMAGQRPPTSAGDNTREWQYWRYNLDNYIPGYDFLYHMNDNKPYATYAGASGSGNGVYGYHADTNAPIPYKGRLYIHRSNVIIALDASGGDAVALPMARTVPVQDSMTPLGPDALRARLAAEVQKMLDAGHLRPGYTSHGIFDLRSKECLGDGLDYFGSPADTVYTLLLALPYLPTDMQTAVRSYIQSEFNSYPPYQYQHIGWASGAARETFITPPDVVADLGNHPPTTQLFNFDPWSFNPFNFYAVWKYAEEFGGAASLYNQVKNDLPPLPSDATLIEMPFVNNAFIAGYMGYLELEKLAGQPESTQIRNQLNRIMALRINTFSKDSPYANAGKTNGDAYCRTLNISRNFIYMVPELADYMRTNIQAQVATAVNEYTELAPYWFVSNAQEGFAENGLNPFFDYHSIFMAKAWVLQEDGTQLERYLDVPGFERGDLFYIQMLTAAIENNVPGFDLTVTPSARAIRSGEIAPFTVNVTPYGGFNQTITVSAPSPSPNLDVRLVSPSVVPPADVSMSMEHLSANQQPAVYTVTVTASGGGIVKTVDVQLLVNPYSIFLPVINR
ncbi:MAG: hypothetical protein Kow0080_25590 [Candidatus Promineifilaceae bacterium]